MSPVHGDAIMVNLIDLGWLVRCKKQLKDLADDPDYAQLIKQHLDNDPKLRDELSYIYVRALNTLESVNKKRFEHFSQQ